jgi:hypothetical protein
MYRQIIGDKVNLSVKLKEQVDIELETGNQINLLRHAAKEVTPNSNSQKTINNITYEIKKLVAEERTASLIWQRTHTPDSRRKYNPKGTNLNSNSKK